MAREPVAGHEDLGGGQEFGPWYDFQTGQPFPRLPMDPRAFQRFARRGWMPGMAPPDLQLQWEAGQTDREEATRESARKAIRTKGGKDIADEVKAANTGPDADDVADKVIDKLIKLGIIKVPVENEIPNQETEAAADLEEAGNQLKLL